MVRRPLFAVALILGAAARVPAAPLGGQTVEIGVNWSGSAPRKLPDGVRTICVRELTYGALDQSVIRDLGRTYYRQLLEQLRSKIQEREPGLQILDFESIGVRIDYGDQNAAQGGTGHGREVTPDLYILPHLSLDIRERAYQKEEHIGKQFAEGFARRFTRGTVGNSSKHESGLKRVVSVGCDMKVTSQAGTVIASYGATETEEAQTKEGWFGVGATSTADFESQGKVIEKLLAKHVAAFLDQFLGPQGKRRIELRNVSPGCLTAIAHYRAKRYVAAAGQANLAYGNSAKRDYNACFIAGLACDAQGEEGFATTWYDRAIEAGTTAQVDVSVFQMARGQVGTDATAAPPSPPAPARTADGSGEGTVIRRGSEGPSVRPVSVEKSSTSVGTGVGQYGPLGKNTPRSSPKSPGSTAGEGTFTLPAELFKELRKASARRLLDDIEPSEIEYLLAEAVRDWLDAEAKRRATRSADDSGRLARSP